MRRIIFILIAIVVSATADAQTGLNIERLLSGHYRKYENVDEVIVKGCRLDAYNLSLYHSLVVKNDEGLFRTMEQLVLADGKDAGDKEIANIGSRLYYAFYSLPPANGCRRYLFFKNSSLKKGGENCATLIYMEGGASVEELKKMFKK